MSRFFSLAAYAEDQSLSRSILNTHTIHRGLTTGALLGIFAGAARTARASSPTSTSISAVPRWRSFLSGLEPNIIRSAAVGSIIGAGILVAGTFMRMRGKEEVEWQDRAWRLLHNKGQVEVDSWSLGGGAVGALLATTRKELASVGTWKRVVGGAGAGSVVGTVGYMIWRHGIKGGVWKE